MIKNRSYYFRKIIQNKTQSRKLRIRGKSGKKCRKTSEKSGEDPEKISQNYNLKEYTVENIEKYKQRKKAGISNPVKNLVLESCSYNILSFTKCFNQSQFLY